MENNLDRMDEFEVTWVTGYVDRFEASQVSYSGGFSIYGNDPGPRFTHFHGLVDGNWTLLLTVREDDLLSIRNLSQVGELS